eukprot:7734435-Pyramimonas_sp.AAC.1
MGVECNLAVIGTGGHLPVKADNERLVEGQLPRYAETLTPVNLGCESAKKPVQSSFRCETRRGLIHRVVNSAMSQKQAQVLHSPRHRHNIEHMLQHIGGGGLVL